MGTTARHLSRRRALRACAVAACIVAVGVTAGANGTPSPEYPTQPRDVQAGADWAREALGFSQLADVRGPLDGRGMRVGVVDTGVSMDHPILSGVELVAWRDFVGDSPVPVDDPSGHGTAVSSIIVGDIRDGRLFGLAPRAQLLVARAIDTRGRAQGNDVVDALRWMADPDGNPSTDDAPDVVNCSWAVAAPNPTLDAAIADLERAGVLVVFAAGNSGPAPGTINPPATAPTTLGVSGVAPSGGMLEMSSRGSDAVGYPDIAAPAQEVLAAHGSDVGLFNGTSLAAPFVSGTALLVRQLRPAWTPREVRDWLTTTAADVGPVGPDADTGAGRLDMAAALAPLIAADPVRPRITDLRVPWRTSAATLTLRAVTTQGAGIRILRPRDTAWIGPLPAGRIRIPVSWRGRADIRVQAVRADGTPEGVVHVVPVLAKRALRARAQPRR